MKLVSIITSTIGRPHLARAIESVKRQSYPNIQHIVAVDGTQNHDSAREILSGYDGIDVFYLPYSTKAWGGRIYAAMPLLSKGDFIMNLDDDNFLEPDHVESLVNTIGDGPWAYSLRNLTVNGSFLMEDNFSSLGLLHPSLMLTPPGCDPGHIDTGCYFMRRNTSLEMCRFWCPERFDDQLYQNDRSFYTELVKRHPQGVCSYKYSLNYELAEKDIPWANRNTKAILEKFNGQLPWASSLESAIK